MPVSRIRSLLLVLGLCAATGGTAQEVFIPTVDRTVTYVHVAYAPVRYFGDPVADSILGGGHLALGVITPGGFAIGVGAGVSRRVYEYVELPLELGYATPAEDWMLLGFFGPTYRVAGNVAAGMVGGFELRFRPLLRRTKWRPLVALAYKWDKRDVRPPDVFNPVEDLSPDVARGLQLRLGLTR